MVKLSMKRPVFVGLVIVFFLFPILVLAMPILPETPYECLFSRTENLRWLALIITKYKLPAWFATVERLTPKKLYERLTKLGYKARFRDDFIYLEPKPSVCIAFFKEGNGWFYKVSLPMSAFSSDDIDLMQVKVLRFSKGWRVLSLVPPRFEKALSNKYKMTVMCEVKKESVDITVGFEPPS